MCSVWLAEPVSGTGTESGPGTEPVSPVARVATGAFLTGFSFGGWFDAILLHLLLQWHRVASFWVESVHLDILLDGVFHGLLFIFLVVGLMLMLWKTPVGVVRGRWLVGWVLVGAGVFHFFDAVVNHWVLRLHRINPESMTFFWDLVFFVFGVVLVVVGWRLRTRGARLDSD